MLIGELIMKKKLQVFISSTYKDLQDERQAAVEAVLSTNNIPAGMELFKAGNNSQWETIKRWINDSDVYMLILGGRYGSIEPTSKKSYTHLEYEYAISQNIPVFATVLSDNFLADKVKNGQNADDIYEHDNKALYEEFKELVMSKMVKPVDDCKDIKLAIHESISELKDEYDFEGWTRGVSDSTYRNLVEQNSKLVQENKELKEQLQHNIEQEQPINIDYEFWNQEIVLNISGMREFMGNTYNSQISIKAKEIFKIIAPFIMTPTSSKKIKEDFEQSLKELYMQNCYSLSIEDNQFQKIKVLLFSKQLIQLSQDSKDSELITLTTDGTSALLEIQN